jgi:hypothetical protein
MILDRRMKVTAHSCQRENGEGTSLTRLRYPGNGSYEETSSLGIDLSDRFALNIQSKISIINNKYIGIDWRR